MSNIKSAMFHVVRVDNNNDNNNNGAFQFQIIEMGYMIPFSSSMQVHISSPNWCIYRYNYVAYMQKEPCVNGER